MQSLKTLESEGKLSVNSIQYPENDQADVVAEFNISRTDGHTMNVELAVVDGEAVFFHKMYRVHSTDAENIGGPADLWMEIQQAFPRAQQAPFY
jgi:hypothetical protein